MTDDEKDVLLRWIKETQSTLGMLTQVQRTMQEEIRMLRNLVSKLVREDTESFTPKQYQYLNEIEKQEKNDG